MKRSKIVKVPVLSILFFLSYNCLDAQKSHKKEIDSINSLIEKSYLEGNFDENLILKNVTDLYYLSHEADDVEGQIISLFEQAKIYFINGNLNTTLAKINEGIDLSKSKNDYNFLCRFLLIYQNLLFKIDYINSSKQILAKAEEYNDVVKSMEEKNVNKIYILIAKADLLVFNENIISINQILTIKKEAYHKALKIKDSNKLKSLTLIYTLESLTESLLKFGKIEEAKKYISINDSYLKVYPSEGLVVQSLVLKGDIENADKNYEEAVKHFSEAIIKAKYSKNDYMLYKIYPLISESYEGLNSSKKAKKYSKAYELLLDSIDALKDKTSDINYIDSIKHKILNKQKQEIQTRDLYFFVAFILIFVLISIVLKIRLKTKNQVENIEIPETISQEEIVTDKKSDVTKELVILATENINTFYIEFQKVYPSFYITLKEDYPELNISDINFCTLIKLNFSIREISQFTNSSVRAAEARKYRINKKMKLKGQNELFIILSMLND